MAEAGAGALGPGTPIHGILREVSVSTGRVVRDPRRRRTVMPYSYCTGGRESVQKWAAQSPIAVQNWRKRGRKKKLPAQICPQLTHAHREGPPYWRTRTLGGKCFFSELKEFFYVKIWHFGSNLLCRCSDCLSVGKELLWKHLGRRQQRSVVANVRNCICLKIKIKIKESLIIQIFNKLFPKFNILQLPFPPIIPNGVLLWQHVDENKNTVMIFVDLGFL